MNPESVPHDLPAEEAICASVMLDELAMDRVVPVVSAADFHHDRTRAVFEAARSLWARGAEINEVTVAHELGAKLADAGGIGYLAQLTTDLPTAIGVEHYAGIVRRCAQYRKAIQIGSKIVQEAYKRAPDFDEFLAKSERLFGTLRDDNSGGGMQSIRNVLDAFWSEPGAYTTDTLMIRTGFPDVDKIVAGFRSGNLVVVAARPSMGKSAFLQNIATNAAIGQNARVALFTLEMANQEWAMRMLSHRSGIPGDRLRLGAMTELEERAAMKATGELADLPMHLADRMIVDPEGMRAHLRMARDRLGGLDLVLVDYLQLMGAPSPKGRERNRTQEVTEISRGLKVIAKDFGVPVIAAAQLNRELEKRTSKVPMLADLRESGAIEQDADLVMLLYREEIYTKREKWEADKKRKGLPYPEGIVEVIVAKQRNGRTGTAHLRMHGATSRFEDVVPEPEPPADVRMPYVEVDA